jgi:hypothetical protein
VLVIPALASVLVMIDSGFSDSFCVALDWNAARSCCSGLVELLVLLELASVLELEESAWCPW